MRILIADDHPMMVSGLCSLLEANGYTVAAMAGDGQEAVDLTLRCQPDLVLMDIRMPGLDGLAATRLIKARQPETKIVIITTSAEDSDLFEAIKSGACGYLIKITTGPAFIAALRGLEAGIPPFSPGLAERLLHEFARLSEQGGNTDGQAGERAPGEPARLKARQVEVLRWVAAGLTYKEVGEKLYISEATVRYHMSEIMRLLHLEYRSQVLAYAGKLGLS